MTFRFVIVSDEVPGFRRDIKIDGSATFRDLNDIILRSVGYSKDQITCFYICDDKWRKEQEVHIMDVGFGSDEEIYLMDETYLEDLLEDEGQKLKFVFDTLGDRAFFMELREITLFDDEEEARIVRSEGNPPEQFSDIDELLSEPVGNVQEGPKKKDILNLDDDFEESESDMDLISPEDIDAEGYSFDDIDDQPF